MTIPQTPWTLDGVSEEARACAREAAEKRGISLAEWLGELVRAACGPAGGGTPEAAGSPPAAGACAGLPPGGVANTIERAVHLVGSLGADPEGSAKTGKPGAAAAAGTDDPAGLPALAERLAQIERAIAQAAETGARAAAECERLSAEAAALRRRMAGD